MNFRLLGSLPQPLTMRRSSWEARSGSWFSAVRVVQRLHPSPEALTEVLESRGASDMVIKCAREYKCVACARYKKPDGVAPSALPRAKEFNERLQADIFGSRSTTTRCLCLTLWTKPPSTKLQLSFQLSVLITFSKLWNGSGFDTLAAQKFWSPIRAEAGMLIAFMTGPAIR